MILTMSFSSWRLYCGKCANDFFISGHYTQNRNYRQQFHILRLRSGQAGQAEFGSEKGKGRDGWTVGEKILEIFEKSVDI
jgi:hypothetical protein